jgi:hypothetical protein
MHRRTLFLALGWSAAGLVGARAASAQTYTPTIAAPYANYYPHRLQGGVDIGIGNRPQNLNPTGISYDDCIQDQSLSFSLTLSGFQGQEIEVWASRNGDCTMDANRGNSGVATCWPVGVSMAAILQTAANTVTLPPIRVQDIVGPQNSSPSPTAYTPQTSAACSSQPQYASETFAIYFLPIANAATYTGMGFQYTLNVDLQGPPPPNMVSIADGDSLFIVNWSPNGDTDTTGYNLYIDPIPGQEGTVTNLPAPPPILVCPDAGSATEADATAEGGGVDSGDDATTDASGDAADASDGAVDAGCHYINAGGSADGSLTCNDALLSSGIVLDAGPQSAIDDAGNTYDAGSNPGNGGISTVPRSHLVGGGSTGVTISDKSSGTYTVTGLTNGAIYNVAVSAVDGFGNVGPPSAVACEQPEPVNDFWHNYRNDGGLAGGGFCALEAVGAPTPPVAGVALFVSAAALARRRRRRPR